MQYKRELTCVSCGSKNICFGYTGSTSNVFVPSGIIVFHGFRTRSYVCLECGHIAQYLPEDKVSKLRDRFKKKLG
jgi:DNA-directed RNA polymerase subunit RPC12/RpoP